MQADILATLAIVVVMALALRLTIKVNRAATEAPDPSAEHIQRLARMRAQQRTQGARPLPARNPGPGLRPHPLHGHRGAAPTSAYVIQPVIEPAALASISTSASPDRIDAAVIHSMTLPIGGGEQAGEFAGAGASGSWSSDSSSTSSSGD